MSSDAPEKGRGRADGRKASSPPGRSRATWALLAGGGAGCFVLTLLAACGLGFAFLAFAGGPHPAKLVGSWKGRFTLPGSSGPEDVLYTFYGDGSFRQQSFGLDGHKIYEDEGRWEFHGGEIKITWDGGHFESGATDWIDNNTFRYRIVGQEDPRQVGVTTTFKRQ